MDIIVDELIIEEDRGKHIAKHKVTIKEVMQIIEGDYVYIQGKENRRLLIGKTNKRRFLTIVVGERNKKNTYGLVTARPASREERSFYKEFTLQKGGENNGKN
jgi:uncharacterized DUF497 family protein